MDNIKTNMTPKAIMGCSMAILIGFAGGFASRGIVDHQAGSKAQEAARNCAMRQTENIAMAPILCPRANGFECDPFFLPVGFELEPMAFPRTIDPNLKMSQFKTVDGKDKFQVTTQMPGLQEKDVKVNFKKDTITIEGQKKRESSDKQKNVSTSEETIFQAVPLPDNVDGSKAITNFKNGILTISIPKKVDAT